MSMRISHVISKKYSNGISNLHVHVKKVHVIMSGEIPQMFVWFEPNRRGVSYVSLG